MHPHMGEVHLNHEVPLLADEDDEQRLITWLPADDATAIALAGTGDTAVPSSPARLASSARNRSGSTAPAVRQYPEQVEKRRARIRMSRPSRSTGVGHASVRTSA
jgi:hypothetical protein